MKPLVYLFLIGMIGLTACSPTQITSGAVENSPAATQGSVEQSPTATPTGGGHSLSSVTGQTTPSPTSENKSVAPAAEIRWDNRPEAKIVTASLSGGLVPPMIHYNYIPSAQIWGDGHMIWTQAESNGQRRVLQGMLSQDQMTALLKGAADQGFFGWSELYTSPLSPTDLPTRCVQINLLSQSKKVCEYYQGAPQAFHDLYDRLAQGAGLTGLGYVPTQAYLVAHSIPSLDLAVDRQKVPTWDAQNTQVSLASAANGVWVQGPALESAWKLVNANNFNPIAQQDGAFYEITLQVPGVSFIDPPAR